MQTKKVSITSNIIIAAKLAIKTDNITPFGGRYSVFNRFRETHCSPGRLAGQTWKGGRRKGFDSYIQYTLSILIFRSVFHSAQLHFVSIVWSLNG